MGKSSRRRADREVAKGFAMLLPDVEMNSHHGTMDMRVRHKIFATFPAKLKAVNVRCAPDNVQQLVKDQPEVFSAVRDGWVQIALEEVDREVMQRMMVEAWKLAAPPGFAEARAAQLERVIR